WRPGQRDGRSGAGLARGRPVGPGVRPEVVIEGAVLLDDEHDVLDGVAWLADPRGAPGRRRTRRTRARGRAGRRPLMALGAGRAAPQPDHAGDAHQAHHQEQQEPVPAGAAPAVPEGGAVVAGVHVAGRTTHRRAPVWRVTTLQDAGWGHEVPETPGRGSST